MKRLFHLEASSRQYKRYQLNIRVCPKKTFITFYYHHGPLPLVSLEMPVCFENLKKRLQQAGNLSDTQLEKFLTLHMSEPDILPTLFWWEEWKKLKPIICR